MSIPGSSLQSESLVLPEGFVYLEEQVPGIQIELRYAGTNNFLGKRVKGYVRERAILTGLAARAVANVQSELAEIGLGLKVFDSYRPQRAVDQFVRWANDPDDLSTRLEYYPSMEKDQLIPGGYLAELSSHSRGSTLDLTIVSLHPGAPGELDMGTPFDYFGPESWPESNAVTPEQHARRMLLQARMGAQGFLPLKEEWWHFTLADEPFPDTYFDFPVEQTRACILKELTGINHVGIRVSDLATTRAFYEQLGFEFLVGPVGPEPVAIMEHPSGVNINFILNGAGPVSDNILMDVPERHPGYTHVALEVTDLEAVQSRLVELDIPLSGGPITVPDGATFIFIRDPDKNVIEFHQPASKPGGYRPHQARSAMDTIAKFAIGELVHHRLFDYRGVIVDVDPDFQLSDEWYDAIARSRPAKDKPWYRVLVHNATHDTYVAEQNLEPDASGEPISHPGIESWFTGLENGRYQTGLPVN